MALKYKYATKYSDNYLHVLIYIVGAIITLSLLLFNLYVFCQTKTKCNKSPYAYISNCHYKTTSASNQAFESILSKVYRRQKQG